MKHAIKSSILITASVLLVSACCSSCSHTDAQTNMHESQIMIGNDHSAKMISVKDSIISTAVNHTEIK